MGRGPSLVTSISVSSPATTQKPERGKLLESIWFRGAMLVAFVEGILVLFGLIPRWVAIGIAVAVVLGYFVRGRQVKDPSGRQALWAITLSQAVVLLVPILGWVLSAAALVIVAIIGVLVLVALIVDR
jgi:hypothetical protein